MAFRALSSEIAPGPNTAACRPTGETDGEAEKHRIPHRRRDARQEDQVVAGRNPVIELLRSGRPVDKILIVRQQEGGGSLGRIVAMAKQAGIPVKDAAREKLDALCPGINHQGVAAFAAACSYCEVEELLARAGRSRPSSSLRTASRTRTISGRSSARPTRPALMG